MTATRESMPALHAQIEESRTAAGLHKDPMKVIDAVLRLAQTKEDVAPVVARLEAAADALRVARSSVPTSLDDGKARAAREAASRLRPAAAR